MPISNNIVVSIQSVNWRTSQTRFLTETGAPIDLTGATGYLVSTDPEGVSSHTAVVLGIWNSPGTQAADAALGYVYAVFKGVSVAGVWSEQFQLVLPTGSEPLYGIVVPFTVNDNLTYS